MFWPRFHSALFCMSKVSDICLYVGHIDEACRIGGCKIAVSFITEVSAMEILLSLMLSTFVIEKIYL